MTPEQNLRVKSLQTRSDVFNYVIDHLRRQGERSLFNRALLEDDSAPFCAYRGIARAEGDKETMCAVGALITDDEYDPSWEGMPVEPLLEELEALAAVASLTTLPCCSSVLELQQRLAPHRDMLVDLQYFHDVQLDYKNGDFNQSSEKVVEILREKWNIE